jgi:hypothetical protein
MSQVDQYLHEPSDFDEAQALLVQSLAVAGEAEREPPGIGAAGTNRAQHRARPGRP